ncbi:MAG: alpha-amylase [Acidobacteriia bacterium]|nr:alpha-amylase [Terriglobia bacterium]
MRLALAAAPVVTKVEPPDWVSERNGITLRILATGRNLAGAAVRSRFRTGPATVSASGTHLFVDLVVPPRAAPGDCPIEIATSDGTVKAPFAIVPPLDPAGRFQGFSSDDVVYLIMPDRFANGDTANDDPPVSSGMHDRARSRFYHGGDLQGIIQRLPYLKDLGVTALWLTPIYDNANRLNQRETYEKQAITDYHGYGAVDFYGVEEHFGSLEKFRELVDKAHALGIKIIQDEVANHTGPYHPWVQDPPTPGWFHGSEAHHFPNTWQTWTLIDPHATPETQRGTLDGWFVDILPDLNQSDPEVARYLIQNTLWWIGRTGIDGIRQDTLPYAPRSFWRDWTAAIRERFPRFDVVGEVFDGDPALVSFFQGGVRRFDGIDSGIDTLFDFPLHYAIRKVFTGAAGFTELARTLGHDYLYQDANRLVTFVGLHDIARFMNESGATMDSLALVFTLLMTARGIPMIYYGDEIGLAGGNDPDNRRDFPGGWPEDARNAFEASGRTPEQQALFERLRRLTHLRAGLEPLRRGAMKDLLVEEGAFAFARVTPRDRVLVVFNNSGEPATLRIPLAGSSISDGAVLADALGQAPPVHAENGAAEVRLRAHSAAIYH